MSIPSGAETARKRFLLWEMGFPDAKISTRSRRARRFCRFPKSSKSVGLGRLENPLGFQPSRRQRFLCERAAALSRSLWGFCQPKPIGNNPAGCLFLGKNGLDVRRAIIAPSRPKTPVPRQTGASTNRGSPRASGAPGRPCTARAAPDRGR